MKVLNVITVVKDHPIGFEETILSLRKAVLPDHWEVRHLICNGGSPVDLPDEVSFENKLNSEIVSSNDLGIYNAMNIGLSHAKSGWVMFLNAGDKLVDRFALLKIFEQLDHSTSSIVQFRTRISPEKVSPHKPYTWLTLYLGLNMHAHPSFIFRSEHLPEIKFDETYKLAGDFKFVLEAIRKAPVQFCEDVIVDFEGGGISSNQPQLAVKEGNRARKELMENSFLRALVIVWNMKISLGTWIRRMILKHV